MLPRDIGQSVAAIRLAEQAHAGERVQQHAECAGIGGGGLRQIGGRHVSRGDVGEHAKLNTGREDAIGRHGHGQRH
jgi:hypothetical protein